jgi:hypothetical protein
MEKNERGKGMRKKKLSNFSNEHVVAQKIKRRI